MAKKGGEKPDEDEDYEEEERAAREAEARGKGHQAEPAAGSHGGPPRLSGEEAAEASRAMAKEGKGKGAKGQPEAEDPDREIGEGEHAANLDLLATKGDLAPAHPPREAVEAAEAVLQETRAKSKGGGGKSEESKRDEEARRFRVISGMVGAVRTGKQGEPSGWLSLKEMNITADMVDRLVEKGVIEEQT